MFSLFFVLTACTSTIEKQQDTSNVEVAPPWPDWAYKHWVWEDESTQESVITMVDGYAAHDIPVGAIIIDSPWATGYNTNEWDTTLFPDPQGLIDELHSRDIRLMLWTVPMINTDVTELYNEAKNAGYFLLTEADGEAAIYEWWKGEGSLIDFHNPDAVEWWHQQVAPLLEMGVDGWKCDGPEFGLALSPGYSATAETTVTRVEYSRMYYQDFHDFSREMGEDHLITARPIDNYGADLGGNSVSFAPVEINWAGWVGDQDPDFEGLKMALRNMYWSADYGYLAFGSDIGGYRTSDEFPLGREKEPFIRWSQMGAFSPVMENGGAGGHWPWLFDQETVDIYKKFTDIHYQLLSYFDTEGLAAIEEERSMLQFTSADRYSYLLGRDIFIAPILEAGGSVDIRFPSGDWIYLFDSTQQFSAATQEISLQYPLDEFPVFLRANSDIANRLLEN